MRHWAHSVRAGSWALALALLGNLAAPALAFAETAATLSQQTAPLQRIDIQDAGDGSLTLLANAPPAPAIYGSFKHFGFEISAIQRFNTPFRSLQIDYTATAPAGSSVRVDARVSADGERWSSWEIDLASGARASFQRAALYAQYRLTLLANADSPTVRVAQLTPLHDPAVYTAMDEPVAPTWKLHATRQGMVGGRTANGHRITKRDHYVSLPSWRALSPEGTTQYMVRVTYNGRSSVAPVYDVGPWNAHDDYWNEQRQRYNDLPRGYPEDHAAYFDGYNGGRAEKGRVRFPTAIDIGDGVWWDDLGIKGDRAVVEVTFLWLGSDPLATPPAPAAEPAPPAPPAPPVEPAPPAPPAQPAPPPPPEATAAPAEPAPPTPEATPSPTPEATESPAPEATPPPTPEVTEPPTPEATAQPTPEATPPPTADEPPPATEAPEATPPPEPTPVATEAPAAAEPVAAEVAPPPALAEAAPKAARPAEVVVDERESSFQGHAKVKWYDGPAECGEGGSALWTFTTTEAAESENTGRWQPALPGEALYDVYVAIPKCEGRKPNTSSAHYVVQHRDGTQDVTVDQAGHAGEWVLLGRFPFKTEGGFVELHDVAGDAMRTIWFDAVKWVRVP